MNPKLLQATLVLVFTCLTVYMLIVAKDLLIPLVLAIFIWFLIASIRQALEDLSIGGRRLPRPAAFTIAIGLILLAAVWLAGLITDNVTQVAQEAPTYQRNFENRVADLSTGVGLETFNDLAGYFENLDLADLIGSSALALTNLLGNAGLIGVYILFLFFEERPFDRKIDLVFTDPQRRADVRALLHRIGSDTRAYVGLKTAVSLMTALPSYALMAWVGLDYAAFWAIMIFVCNFVPNIGSLFATALPSLLALVQFDTWRPFLIVAVGVTATQLLVANLIEPRIMAKSLNLSPLVIILSLVIWGTLWGIAGMFLCVPLMVILMIVLSHFPSTRPVAIMLSQDGEIRETREMRPD